MSLLQSWRPVGRIAEIGTFAGGRRCSAVRKTTPHRYVDEVLDFCTNAPLLARRRALVVIQHHDPNRSERSG